jgi:hypothetical protein
VRCSPAVCVRHSSQVPESRYVGSANTEDYVHLNAAATNIHNQLYLGTLVVQGLQLIRER